MNKPRALVIEDEYDISLIFARALQDAGYQTEIIRAGDTALTWLAAEVPDLVVLDLQLPSVPGTEIFRLIREDPRMANTRIIVATAFSHLAEGLRSEADWVLIKPVNFIQLRDLAKQLRSNSPAGDIPLGAQLLEREDSNG